MLATPAPAASATSLIGASRPRCENTAAAAASSRSRFSDPVSEVQPGGVSPRPDRAPAGATGMIIPLRSSLVSTSAVNLHRTPPAGGADGTRPDPRGANYKWIALSNCTLGVLLATLDASITLIAMPDIFDGIKLDPLVPGNSFYLLWMILGFLVVSSVLIVSLGRLGDMYGRVRIYNLGFVIYTVASLILAVDWLTGPPGALYLVVFRIVQGIGGACLLANLAAIITDAFPANQRGMALGINNIVAVSGLFVGLVLGGVLAPINWRLVFLLSVPVGIFGTVWAYTSLRELSSPKAAPIDWWGNVTFALGLILIMTAVTYGIRPADGHAVGWGSTKVLALLGAGLASLITFVIVEQRSHDP